MNTERSYPQVYKSILILDEGIKAIANMKTIRLDEEPALPPANCISMAFASRSSSTPTMVCIMILISLTEESALVFNLTEVQ